MNGSVDIIIPTCGRPADASRLVASLVPLCGKHDGIIVVEQGGAGPLSEGSSMVRHLRLQKPNLPAARNAGVRASDADIVLFLDDDVEPLPGLVDAHRSCYADPSIAAVAGFVDDPLFDRAQILPSRIDLSTGSCVQNFSLSSSGSTISAMGANMSFQRLPLLSIGGFDEQYLANALWEEIDCCLRLIAAGHHLYFCSAAKVVHLRRADGGCRRLRGHRYLYHQFANTAYFAARFAQARHYGSWAKFWKRKLEFLSRKDSAPGGKTGHDPCAVMAGAMGAAAGILRFFNTVTRRNAAGSRIDKQAVYRSIEQACAP
ncbi:MAG: glycosyltransferase [Chitinispirillaceae bacterium]|nr:glycosyltransferase [Chitinispirillaceae bacterium]